VIKQDIFHKPGFEKLSFKYKSFIFSRSLPADEFISNIRYFEKQSQKVETVSRKKEPPALG